MKKKTSLINLSNTEIKKNELKETLAGQHGGDVKKHFTHSGGVGNTGLLAATTVSCSAWCYCSCTSDNSFFTLTWTGNSNASLNWVWGIVEG